jgi:hypothetical protein
MPVLQGIMRLLTTGSCDVLVGLLTRGLGAHRVLLAGRSVIARDELLAHTAVPGNEHERRRLDQLRDKFAVVVYWPSGIYGRPADGLPPKATQCAMADAAAEIRVDPLLSHRPRSWAMRCRSGVCWRRSQRSCTPTGPIRSDWSDPKESPADPSICMSDGLRASGILRALVSFSAQYDVGHSGADGDRATYTLSDNDTQRVSAGGYRIESSLPNRLETLLDPCNILELSSRFS